MEQFLLHILGDYVTQSDWMATEKTRQNTAAGVHALVYGLPFFLLTDSANAVWVIVFTHFLIDRFRLAKYVCYIKNFIAPPSAVFSLNPTDADLREGDHFGRIKGKYAWENCSLTGYPKEVPPFLAFWLMIIVDNFMHLSINYLALKCL